MQITITGPRGCGKTTVAVEIAKFLRASGCDVRIVGDGPRDNALLRSAIKAEPQPSAMWLPWPVTIVDSFERHDEAEIRKIAAASIDKHPRSHRHGTTH